MGLRIGTNVAALTANRNLSRVSARLGRAFEHLATGSRISRASDDAAGVAISARLRARVRSLDQAARNANDGISLLATADGALGEMEDVLIRMRELAVQASNGTLSSQDRTALQQEFSDLRASASALSEAAEFNGTALLNNTNSLTLQVGADTSVTFDQLVITLTDNDQTALSIDTLNISTAASTAITKLDTALQTIATNRSTYGAATNRLETTVSSLQIRSENLAAANSRIQDVDVATETAKLTRDSILQQAAISVLAQANAAPQAALSLLQ